MAATATAPAPIDLLPWSWAISPEDQSVTNCPSPSWILGTLAIVNVVVTVLSIPFGNRYFLNRLTCRFLFNAKSSNAYRYTWVFTVALQLGANALIAMIFQRTPGYRASFKIWELMLFFTIRPRLSWIALNLFGLIKKGEPLSATPHPPEYSTNDTREDPYGSEEDLPWISSALSQYIAEFFLRLIAFYVAGRTAHFATARGYYQITSAAYHSLPQEAHLMYAGALYYIVGGVFGIMLDIAVVMDLAHTQNKLRKSGVEAAYLAEIREFVPGLIIFSLVCSWIGSWIFWAGFVRLAGDLYCPPNLYAQGAIWAGFSLVGIVLGTGAG
ncbi:hypothetical protein K458DRAFT_210776 [Lentithecium fluviatile CBS 122367]|uniref:Uncharacterized protein n=1 Tax=Lentithecium fluviatile CBS 122367 TaxID=1168545 RepID=A0A6G1J850_9PLEO|nr:hypothetical protein K458DRAFT_210776 [Lentithecium fluviatile CBS 122367]